MAVATPDVAVQVAASVSSETSASSAAPDVIIRVADLAKTYAMGDVTVHALRGVSFEVQRGELVAVENPLAADQGEKFPLLVRGGAAFRDAEWCGSHWPGAGSGEYRTGKTG